MPCAALPIANVPAMHCTLNYHARILPPAARAHPATLHLSLASRGARPKLSAAPPFLPLAPLQIMHPYDDIFT